MSNQEIRRKALRLYRENFFAFMVLGLCYSTLGQIVSVIWNMTGGNQTLCGLMCWLLGSPLTLGAVLCLAHMWRTESAPHYGDLVTFYRSIGGWGGSLLLFLLQAMAILLPLFLPVLLLNPALIVLGMIAGIVVVFWLLLRIEMAGVLFVSEEDMSAWEAVKDSFFRMSGQVAELLCMMLSVEVIPLVVDVLFQWGLVLNGVLSVQSANIFLVVFALFYQPFGFAAVTGWVIERLNDEEQPEEAYGQPEDQLLREIANDLAKKEGTQPGMQSKG